MAQEEVTAVLTATHADSRDALDALFPLVYAELRRMAHTALAREGGPRTLDTNALVHEAYLRMVDSTQVSERGRGYFFAAAARAMRQVLVDSARRRRAKKRTAGERRVTLETDTVAVDAFADEIVDIDRMLARLATSHARAVHVVECRFFAGLSVEETAGALDLSPRTVKRDWAFAQTWLKRELSHES
jgi:RNA polymerase sigma factor (TIGR02999 family)